MGRPPAEGYRRVAASGSARSSKTVLAAVIAGVKLRGSQAPRQTVRRSSSALSNLGRSACPAIPGMERNVTNPLIDRLIQAARPGWHDHAPTPAEIQRWEDDGGAILPDPPRRTERHHHDDIELAAA